MPAGRKTSPAIAKIASKVLQSDNYSKDAKKLAASALSQAAPKSKSSKK